MTIAATALGIEARGTTRVSHRGRIARDRPKGAINLVPGQPVRFEKVEPGDEQILPPRAQRELDALPSGLDREREA
jgi:hypothetical protein